MQSGIEMMMEIFTDDSAKISSRGLLLDKFFYCLTFCITGRGDLTAH